MASYFHVYFYKKYKKKESRYKGIPAYEKEKDFEKSLIGFVQILIYIVNVMNL